MEILQNVVGNLDLLITTLLALVVTASAVVAGTPTPKPDTTLGKLYYYLELLSLTIGHAKEKGDESPK